MYLTVQSDYRRVQIPLDDIAYITVEDRKTKITRGDGSVIRTNKSLKDVYAELPENTFSNINRGIIVSARYVQNEVNGILTMKDGTKLRRRVRSDRLPKRQSAPKPTIAARHVACPASELSKWLSSMPIPMLILELVPAASGVDFRIRLCTPALCALLDMPQEALADQSAQLLPGIGSAKWMAVFADVAVNGGSRIIEDVPVSAGRFIRLQCYQPQPGYCGCVLIDLTKENHLVQQLFCQE